MSSDLDCNTYDFQFVCVSNLFININQILYYYECVLTVKRCGWIPAAVCVCVYGMCGVCFYSVAQM